MNVRAIEHVGITVPDMEAATRFFVEAFGAEKLYDMLDAPLGGLRWSRDWALQPVP